MVRYLLAYGAPLPGGEPARTAALMLLAEPGSRSSDEVEALLACLAPDILSTVTGVVGRASGARAQIELIPKAAWSKTLDADQLAVLKHFRYGPLTEGSLENVVARHPPPLLAAFHPSELIGSALVAKDVDRVRRLIARGGANGEFRFSRMPGLDDMPIEYRGLTATGLAFLIDSDNERLSAGRMLWRRCTAAPPVFTTLLVGKQALHGAHDSAGNTLLHMAVTPGMCGWLLERGVALDVKNSAGLLAEETVPDYVRDVIEEHRTVSLSPAGRGGGRKRSKK